MTYHKKAKLVGFTALAVMALLLATHVLKGTAEADHPGSPPHNNHHMDDAHGSGFWLTGLITQDYIGDPAYFWQGDALSTAMPSAINMVQTTTRGRHRCGPGPVVHQWNRTVADTGTQQVRSESGVVPLSGCGGTDVCNQAAGTHYFQHTSTFGTISFGTAEGTAAHIIPCDGTAPE